MSRPAAPTTPWTIGRYDEDRVIYTTPLFEGRRTLHVGLDLGGPEGVAVHAPADGRVVHGRLNPAPGDYGPTLVIELEGPLWVLLGHLDARTLDHTKPGAAFRRGEVLGWLGGPAINGGYPPHVHVQLAWERPAVGDLPGVVAPSERAQALARWPDPRLLLGPLY